MNAGNTNKPDRVDEELQHLADMRDDEIDKSDIPEIRDWSQAERGKFYRPSAVHQVPLYLDGEVLEFLTTRARARGIEPHDLANEMLKKDIELDRSVESGRLPMLSNTQDSHREMTADATDIADWA